MQEYAEKVSGRNVDDSFGIDLDFDDEEVAASDFAAESRTDTGAGKTFKPMRPLTVTSKLQTLRVVVNALHRSGSPVEQITSLACLVTPLSQPRAILTQLLKENGGETAPKIGHAADLLRQLAKYHVRCSGKHIEQMSRWARKVRVEYPEMTIRNRKLLERLTPFIRQYLDTIRPALLRGKLHDALWVGRDGTPWRRKASRT